MHTEPSNTDPDRPNDTVPTPASDRRALLAGIGSLAAGAMLLGSRTAQAGPLNPPAGPVASTGKTITEAEPRIAVNATNTPGDPDSCIFRITQPGSYYLTGNIQGVVGKHGIEIASGGVTLDLNGFDLVGIAGTGLFDGVRVTAGGAGGIAVFNGSVRNWTGNGINMSDASTIVCRVEKVLAYVNGRSGILTGEGTTVTDCSASLNGGVGISVSSGSTVLNCSAYDNTGPGIAAGVSATVSNCSASSNTGSGITVGNAVTISNCSASFNTGNGIDTLFSCTVVNCTASYNTLNGISIGLNNTGRGSTVAECTTRANSLDGIVCISQCVIRGNTCTGSGAAAGIHVTGTNNRIEGNTCIGSGRGIDVDSGGNIIIRNTASGNTVSWDVVAGNVCLVVQGAASGAILGDTGGVAPGSTDPNANFTY